MSYDYSSLLVDKKTDERFNRLYRNALKKNGFAVVRRPSGDYYIVTDGENELGFDISTEKFLFARSRDESIAEKLVKRTEGDFDALDRLVSFTNGQEFLRYVIMREEEISPSMIAAPVSAKLRKVMCYSGDDVHARILDSTYLTRWDIPPQVMFSVADRNLSRLLDSVKLDVSVISDDMPVRCIEFTARNAFTAALMTCSDFYPFMVPKLGKVFLACAPSKDFMVAVSDVSGHMLETVRDALNEEFRFASTPLSTEMFKFTGGGFKVLDE
ncbi:MAG: hypothetical protein IKP75_09570 [Oscillospiraceae bacterium]|nr:hypothetical protein [Oscillospiraceae bacterium]